MKMALSLLVASARHMAYAYGCALLHRRYLSRYLDVASMFL
jgi:hypothetical protein